LAYIEFHDADDSVELFVSGDVLPVFVSNSEGTLGLKFHEVRTAGYVSMDESARVDISGIYQVDIVNSTHINRLIRNHDQFELRSFGHVNTFDSSPNRMTIRNHEKVEGLLLPESQVCMFNLRNVCFNSRSDEVINGEVGLIKDWVKNILSSGPHSVTLRRMLSERKGIPARQLPDVVDAVFGIELRLRDLLIALDGVLDCDRFLTLLTAHLTQALRDTEGNIDQKSFVNVYDSVVDYGGVDVPDAILIDAAGKLQVVTNGVENEVDRNESNPVPFKSPVPQTPATDGLQTPEEVKKIPSTPPPAYEDLSKLSTVPKDEKLVRQVIEIDMVNDDMYLSAAERALKSLTTERADTIYLVVMHGESNAVNPSIQKYGQTIRDKMTHDTLLYYESGESANQVNEPIPFLTSKIDELKKKMAKPKKEFTKVVLLLRNKEGKYAFGHTAKGCFIPSGAGADLKSGLSRATKRVFPGKASFDVLNEFKVKRENTTFVAKVAVTKSSKLMQPYTFQEPSAILKSIKDLSEIPEVLKFASDILQMTTHAPPSSASDESISTKDKAETDKSKGDWGDDCDEEFQDAEFQDAEEADDTVSLKSASSCSSAASSVSSGQKAHKKARVADEKIFFQSVRYLDLSNGSVAQKEGEGTYAVKVRECQQSDDMKIGGTFTILLPDVAVGLELKRTVQTSLEVTVKPESQVAHTVGVGFKPVSYKEAKHTHISKIDNISIQVNAGMVDPSLNDAVVVIVKDFLLDYLRLRVKNGLVDEDADDIAKNWNPTVSTCIRTLLSSA